MTTTLSQLLTVTAVSTAPNTSWQCEHFSTWTDLGDKFRRKDNELEIDDVMQSKKET